MASETKMEAAWRKIDTAPTDGTRILVAWVGSDDMEIVFWSGYKDAWCASDGGWGSDRWRGDDSPTHWMPLPDRPKDWWDEPAANSTDVAAADITQTE